MSPQVTNSISLKDALRFVVDNRGKTAPASKSGHKLIATNCINNTNLYPIYENVRYVSQHTYETWFRAHPEPFDIILTNKGSQNGAVCLVPEVVDFCIAQDMMALRADESKIDPLFLFAALRSKPVQSAIKGLNVDGVIPHFKKTDFDKLLLPLPDRAEQERIGIIHFDLCSKIELNRRTNETLEAMAQAIFKDWFVDFGPVRRKMQGETKPSAIMGGLIQDSAKATELATLFPDALGANDLPEGWVERTIDDDFDVVMGQSPPGDTYNETGDGLPFFQGRRDFGWRFPSRRVFCNQPNRISRSDWTLVSVRAPVGDINRAWEECCIGRGVGAFMHRSSLGSFTYYVGLHLREVLASYDNDGTVFGSINQKQFKGLTLAGANTELSHVFDDLIMPIDAQIRSLTGQSQTLVQARDYLLPKLMSGEIRASDTRNLVA